MGLMDSIFILPNFTLLTKELGLRDGMELNEVVKNAGEHGVRAIAQVFVEHRGLYLSFSHHFGGQLKIRS